ncbi:hypothetical protein [Rhizobium sp. 10PS4]|uniref:hypothetical protein n=1 Tax=Rhizobium sp. 10PS4 TaxID=3075621 RepID=UPI0028FD7C76|nr:hypothetical protein [Rhizobium sp. 10PS4]MDU0310387.1 hypothetical protein [Rhizobium sp. 10PS4]
MRNRAAGGVLEQAKAAATAKMIGKLLRKHPLIAAELVASGAARGLAVGIDEVRHLVFGGDATKERGSSDEGE